MADEMNPCTASAFQFAEIVQVLHHLLDAYGAEPIRETHQAIVKADLNNLNRAMDSVVHANAECCEGVQFKRKRNNTLQPRRSK